LGAVRGAYGLKGWVRIASHDADATVLRTARRWWLKKGAEMKVLEVTGVRRHGGVLIAKWQGCDDPESAEAFRSAIVSVGRADFPAPRAGEFYWVDLIGARVVNRAGIELGTVTGLRNNGAQDLLEVAGGSRAVLLIPLVEGYVERIDAGERLVRVDWERDW
jgi:16S rRNA processing protein RimM